MNGTKKCTECGRVLPITQFNKHRGNKDGLQNRCRECFSAYNRKRYQHNAEETKMAVKSYRAANAINVFQTRMKMCEKNPTHKNAYRAVDEAIRSGIISKPDHCYGCGKQGRVEAHHHDYRNPLEVLWLCKKCHASLDATRRTQEHKKPWSRCCAVIAIKGGSVIAEYSSIAEAAREQNCCRSSISSCISGKQKTANGYEWRRKESE